MRLGVEAAFIDGAFVDGDLEVVDGRIVAAGLPSRGGGFAIPGLVDAQVNGYAGVDLYSADSDGLAHIGEALLEDGVLAYQPTLITGAEPETVAALERIGAFVERGGPGATILGVHLEGPFLSPERPGAHPVEHLRPPDPLLLERLLAAGPVSTVTLAPELPGSLELIDICVSRGVAVWLGHSQATADEASKGFDAGAAAVTHLFNAMPPLSARAPGLAGAALTRSLTAVQLIADGVHMADEVIRIVFAAAPGRCSLVTDAIAATGMGDGVFRMGEVEVEVREGVSRRADGVLAGSTGRLVDGLRRLVGLGIPMADAVASVTELPARLLGAGSRRLQVGGPADLIVVDDELTALRVVVSRRPGQPDDQADLLTRKGFGLGTG